MTVQQSIVIRWPAAFGVTLAFCVAAGAIGSYCSADETAPEERKPSLALCASGNEMAEAIGAMVEAELSWRDEIVVLDREHVKDVLAEHQLQLKGLLTADDALKVGELLKCDVLAELHHDAATSENADVMSLVAFDSLTGVRLYDGALPAQGDLDERAAAASKALALGLAKWQGGGTVPQCRTLSFVSIRQLDLPEDLNHAPRTVGLLLERRLVNSPVVAILERERLDLIRRESKLTGLRRDRLLVSSVLVDLDFLRDQQNGSLRANAVLTDGAGEAIGTLHAVGRAKDLGGLVDNLAGAISDKLKLIPTEGPTVLPGVEADRFLADALRLELRGRKDEAAISERAATMLAEAALARTPWNVPVQKVVCRLLRRQTARTSNADRALALLEQQIEYSDRWDYGEDTQWFTNSFASELHQTLRRLGPGAQTERVRKLRDRFGNWCQRMAEQDAACIDGLVCVEAWSNSAGQMLEDVGRHLDTLPAGLGLVRYSKASDYLPEPHQDYLYQPLQFSPAERKKLLVLYERWGQGSATVPDESDSEASLSRRLGLFRRMQSYICAAFLVHRFSGELDDAPKRVEQYLHQAAEIVLADPTLSGRFVHMCDARGPKPSPIYKPLPREAITAETLWLVEELDGRRIACPTLLEYLDEHHADHADHPGAYLEKAWTQLDSPDYVPPRGDVLKPRFPEEYVERVEHTFRSRYGRDLEQVQPAEIAEAELASIERLFEFESVPGISTVESAELAGDWVYLLCLHPNPRSYEMRRVNLRTAKAEILAEIVTDAEYRALTGNEIHIGAETVYVPTSDGVICFDRHAKKAWTITQEDGLPTARVTACLEAAGRLYLGLKGLEEGYLAVCEPSNGKVNVLACSGRKDKHSALDDCAPYTIDSMIYDESRDRIFIVTMFLEPEASDRPWLWAYDLNSGEIREVHRQPYHPLQLRLLSNGTCVFHLADMHTHKQVTRTLPDGSHTKVTLRVPSAGGARGYAQWDFSVCDGTPLGDLKDHVTPLIGNIDPEKLKTRYRVPTFCGDSHTLPGTASSMELFGDGCLVSSGVRRTPLAITPISRRFMKTEQAGFGRPWQLIPRDDTGQTVRSLPALDGEAPFAVRVHEDRIVACTQSGLWLLRPKLPVRLADSTGRGNRHTRDSVSERTEDKCRVGGLVVRAPAGALVHIGDEPGFRVWKEGNLRWNDLPVGRHTIRVDFYEKTVKEVIDVKEAQTCQVTASFGEELAKSQTLHLPDGQKMELVWIPTPLARSEQEAPWTLPEGFWLGKYEVTQEQYQAVMGSNPSAYLANGHPVENVGRSGTEAFCRRVTETNAAQLDGWIVRLPSEDEWVYACKARTTSKHYSGETAEDLFREGWFPQNSGGRTHPVGGKMPNPFWLYDMPGNVSEWCERGNPHGGSWRAYGGSPAGGVGFRVVLSTTDTQRSVDREGWTHLAYLDPIRVKVGYGGFRAYKRRDRNPPIAGGDRDAFKTMLLVHAVSSVRYELGGKYREFQTFYARPKSAAGVARFAVVCDGQQKYRGPRVWSWRGTERSGLKKPVTIDLSGVDVLEVVTYGDDNGSISGSFGLWVDPKVR